MCQACNFGYQPSRILIMEQRLKETVPAINMFVGKGNQSQQDEGMPERQWKLEVLFQKA